jgi:hypothetical protein
MTGFLGRLAARIVGPAPMLRPRQPSMFEVVRLADSGGDVADGGQAVGVEAAPVGDVPIAAAAARNLHSGPAAGEAERVPDRRSRRGRQSSIEPQDVVSPVRPPDPTPTADLARDAHRQIHPRTSIVVDTEITARRFAASDETSRHGTLAVRAPLYPAQHDKPSPPRPAGMPGVSRAPVDPVVHVSIGRIELRAQAPSKQVRHQSSPKGTSLDDYLRQRGDRVRP